MITRQRFNMLFQEIRDSLTEVCDHYERSAPTVHAWANDLYIRMNEHPEKVTMYELMRVPIFNHEDGEWAPPGVAANQVYHLMTELRMDTTGHAGY